ncbi:hypothetical protein CHUAL_009001 [Chamberlinius hualienensis]
MSVRSFILMLIAGQVSLSWALNVMQGPESISVSENSTATLECRFNGPAKECAWSKDGEFTIVQEPYNYVGQPEVGDCSIRINGVNFGRDDGLWKCQYPRVGNNPAVVSNQARLTVLVPPMDPVLLFNGQEVEEGGRLLIENPTDNVTVTCISSNGNPPSELYWMVDNERKDGTNRNESILTEQSIRLFKAESQLQFNVGSGLSETQIKCIAEHPTYNGRLHQAYGYFQVHHNTTEVFASVGGSYKTSVAAEPDEKITLYCVANGIPAPSYTWAFQAKGANTWEDLGNQQNLTTTATPGNFICKAKNDYNLDPVPSVDQITVEIKEKRVVSDNTSGGSTGSSTFVLLVLAAAIHHLFIN